PNHAPRSLAPTRLPVAGAARLSFAVGDADEAERSTRPVPRAAASGTRTTDSRPENGRWWSRVLPGAKAQRRDDDAVRVLQGCQRVYSYRVRCASRPEDALVAQLSIVMPPPLRRPLVPMT